MLNKMLRRIAFAALLLGLTIALGSSLMAQENQRDERDDLFQVMVAPEDSDRSTVTGAQVSIAGYRAEYDSQRGWYVVKIPAAIITALPRQRAKIEISHPDFQDFAQEYRLRDQFLLSVTLEEPPKPADREIAYGPQRIPVMTDGKSILVRIEPPAGQLPRAVVEELAQNLSLRIVGQEGGVDGDETLYTATLFVVRHDDDRPLAARNNRALKVLRGDDRVRFAAPMLTMAERHGSPMGLKTTMRVDFAEGISQEEATDLLFERGFHNVHRARARRSSTNTALIVTLGEDVGWGAADVGLELLSLPEIEAVENQLYAVASLTR